MNHISKPHIVDLLRIFDKRKFFVPRIRYASVRSKPELLKDLKYYFGTRLNEGLCTSSPTPLSLLGFLGFTTVLRNGSTTLTGWR